MVKNEVVNKYKIPQSDIDRGGLRIVSTVDKAKQSDMVKAVRAERPEDTPSVHVGMASIKPGNGAIVALYGGEDYTKRQQNAATQDKMQAGSTFKIFTLIAALQSGDFSLNSRLSGASPQYFEEFADPSALHRRRPSWPGEELRQRVASARSTCARRPAARSTPSTRP